MWAWAPIRDTVPCKYCLTILRLPVQEASREQVLTSSGWFDTLETIISYSNWRFTYVAQEVQSTKLVVFVGWKPNTDPPVVFTKQNNDLDALLSPLQHFWGPENLQVLNLCTLKPRMGSYCLRVEKRGGEKRIMEALTVHGPRETVERNVLQIEKELRGYWDYRYLCIGVADHSARKHALTTYPILFRELQTNILDSASRPDQESPASIRLTLFMQWSDEEGRSGFHDPTVPDLEIPRSARERLGSDYWERRIAPRLKELADQGATVTSWDYENAKIARDRNGKVTTSRQDKIW